LQDWKKKKIERQLFCIWIR